MSHQGGVRTIAVGGRPTKGPMQAVSGSRGAAAYSSDVLDTDIRQVNATLNDLEAVSRLPDRRDTGMWINYAGFTMRNQVRQNDPTPLHFRFQAADCRIFYTLKNVYNLKQLWLDAVKATWDDSSLCVEGSTGYPSLRNTDSNKPPPPSGNHTQVAKFDFNPDAPQAANATFEIHDGPDPSDRQAITFKPCDAIDESKTAKDRKCMYMDVRCTTQTNRVYYVGVPYWRWRCEIPTQSDGCQGVGKCAKFAIQPSKAHTNGNTDTEAYWGYCGREDPPKKDQYCVADVAARTTWPDYALSQTFASKCGKTPYMTKDKKIPKAQCQQRMRIFQKQTFAVWIKKGVAGRVEVGECWAYTCPAPSKNDIVAKKDSTVFIWPSAVGSAIMKGLGG